MQSKRSTSPAVCEVGQKGFNDLPDEILLEIFQSLPKRDVKSCALVSQRWRRVAYDKCLGIWSSKYMRDSCRGRSLPLDTICIAASNGVDKLDLTRCKIPDSVTWNIEWSNNLRHINLWRTEISAESLAYLISSNPELKSVKLEEIETVDSTVCSVIGTLEKINKLYLKKTNNITKTELEALSPALKRVTYLKMCQIPMGEEELDILTSSLNPAMYSLRLGCVKGAFQDHHILQILSTCLNLQLLILWNTTSLTHVARTAIRGAGIPLAFSGLVELHHDVNRNEDMAQIAPHGGDGAQ